MRVHEFKHAVATDTATKAPVSIGVDLDAIAAWYPSPSIPGALLLMATGGGMVPVLTSFDSFTKLKKKGTKK